MSLISVRTPTSAERGANAISGQSIDVAVINDGDSRAEWRTQNIATEGRNSPQIARREPARFRDRPVPVAHKRPDRTCPGLPVHATRARFQ
jgi:hypothetical protein